MKTLKDYLCENTLKETRKYISVIYDDTTQEKLRSYCVKNGFDLSKKYNGEDQKITDFVFHTTVFYSTTTHKIKNEIKDFHPSEAYAVSFDMFGQNYDVPVLKLDSEAIYNLREYYKNKYNMEDEWADFKPHISLSYNRVDLPDIDNIPLPDFVLIFDKIKIEDLDDN